MSSTIFLSGYPQMLEQIPTSAAKLSLDYSMCLNTCCLLNVSFETLYSFQIYLSKIFCFIGEQQTDTNCTLQSKTTMRKRKFSRGMKFPLRTTEKLPTPAELNSKPVSSLDLVSCRQPLRVLYCKAST